MFPNIEAIGYLVKGDKVTRYNHSKKHVAEEVKSAVRSAVKRKAYGINI
jgi:hypothetical protein